MGCFEQRYIFKKQNRVIPGGLNISKVEHLAQELVDLYKTLNAYDLLPKNIDTYYQPAFA